MPTLAQYIKKHTCWLDMLLLAAISAGLRLWGIGFDLPLLYHRDEAKYVTIPLRILKTGDYHPHFFNYPSLFFYLLSLAYVAYFLLMAARGNLGNLDSLTLPEQVMPNVVGRATMPSQFLVGRAVSVLAGVTTVLILYDLVRRAFGRRAALVAALLLAVSPTHVRNSHFVAPDVSMICISTASLWFSYQVLLHGKRRDYWLAGLLAGLAISTKYNAYPVVIPLVAAHLMREKRTALLDAGIGGAFTAIGAGFLIGTPYAFLDLPAFLNGLAFELRHYATVGDPGIETRSALGWYAEYLLRAEGVSLLLGLAQATRGFLRRDRTTIWFASLPAAFIVLTAFSVVKNDRTVLAVLPALLALAGAFVDWALIAAQSTARMRGKHASLALTLIAGLALVAWPAYHAVLIDSRFEQDDVRTLATRWLAANTTSGARIVGEYYSPLAPSIGLDLAWIDRAIDQSIDWYRANVDYVVFVQNRYGGYYLTPSAYPREIEAYETMFREFELVKEFDGGALGNPCMARIYRVTP